MVRVASCAALCVLWFGAVASPAEEARWSFDDSKIGVLPENWTEAKTGEGPGSMWRTVADGSAPSGSQALAQMSSAGPRPLFNLCVAPNMSFRNMDLTVSLKAVCGVIDQGGGPVWRYQDANNYYIARANPLEGNFRVYKVVGGTRTQLDTADLDVPAGQWHELRVVHNADQIRCYLNGSLLLEVSDATLGSAGSVGLWTKADAVTFFDNLRVAEAE
jgi:hypothetical protein